MSKKSTALARARQPLVLHGPTTLRVRGGKLSVATGAGCLGAREEFEVSPPLPYSCVVGVNLEGSLSTDALEMLSDHSIGLLAVRTRGKLLYSISPAETPLKPSLVRRQAALHGSSEGLAFVKRLIIEKLKAQRAVLLEAFEAEAAAETLEVIERRVNGCESIDVARGLEGLAADTYWRVWQRVQIDWKTQPKGCKQVPDSWRGFSNRVSLITGLNKRACNPINAALNFGYAILEGVATLQVKAASLCPELGVLHADVPGRPSYVLDVMEPARPGVDRFVLDFIAKGPHTLGKSFCLLPEGECRLSMEASINFSRELAAKLTGIQTNYL